METSQIKEYRKLNGIHLQASAPCLAFGITTTFYSLSSERNAEPPTPLIKR